MHFPLVDDTRLDFFTADFVALDVVNCVNLVNEVNNGSDNQNLPNNK
jgi:hypothetical protein